MVGMMGMELRAGLEGVGIRVSIDKDLGMAMGFIGSIQVTLMLVSGVVGRAMALEFRLVLMVAVLLGSLSVVSNMALVATISGQFFNFDETPTFPILFFFFFFLCFFFFFFFLFFFFLFIYNFINYFQFLEIFLD